MSKILVESGSKITSESNLVFSNPSTNFNDIISNSATAKDLQMPVSEKKNSCDDEIEGGYFSVLENTGMTNHCGIGLFGGKYQTNSEEQSEEGSETDDLPVQIPDNVNNDVPNYHSFDAIYQADSVVIPADFKEVKETEKQGSNKGLFDTSMTNTVELSDISPKPSEQFILIGENLAQDSSNQEFVTMVKKSGSMIVGMAMQQGSGSSIINQKEKTEEESAAKSEPPRSEVQKILDPVKEEVIVDSIGGDLTQIGEEDEIRNNLYLKRYMEVQNEYLRNKIANEDQYHKSIIQLNEQKLQDSEVRLEQLMNMFIGMRNRFSK